MLNILRICYVNVLAGIGCDDSLHGLAVIPVASAEIQVRSIENCDSPLAGRHLYRAEDSVSGACSNHGCKDNRYYFLSLHCPDPLLPLHRYVRFPSTSSPLFDHFSLPYARQDLSAREEIERRHGSQRVSVPLPQFRDHA